MAGLSGRLATGRQGEQSAGQRAAATPSQILATPGQPLGEATRAVMEHRFGRDFSRVRVHTDAAAARSASSLNARAYTVGQHIVFGAGQYAPGSEPGAHVLAHELAHVLQQDERSANRQAGTDAIAVSDPSDPAERTAEAATRAGAGVPVRALPATTPGALLVQRYQAGETPTAHGGIEEEALQEAGFSKGEAKLAYYGNWLRDLSQLAGSPAMDEVIAILATGEFGHPPAKGELGGYLPSEHLDRPEGGGTAEDPLLPAGSQREKATAGLSAEQQAWVKKEKTDEFARQLAKDVAESGLPSWIEAGKEHAKQKLREAIGLGRNASGLEAMGNGLHAIEDYFSHSNFTEVALAQLVSDGKIPPSDPRVRAMRHYVGVDPANLGTDAKGRPEIVTGSYSPDGNKAVSLWETIKTEIQTGELSRTFAKGFVIRYGWQAAGGTGRKILGAAGGAIGAAVVGAAKEAASGWAQAKHGWQKPFAALGGLFSGAAGGAATGASSGWHAGKDVGGAIGQAAFGASGVLITGTVIAAVLAAASPLLSAASAAAAALAEGQINRGTRESAAKAPAGAAPTHAQIAKDAPDHPLFAASRALAHEADVAIGRAMNLAWASPCPAEELAQRAKPVDELVDRYVTHPAANDWWKRVLT